MASGWLHRDCRIAVLADAALHLNARLGPLSHKHAAPRRRLRAVPCGDSVVEVELWRPHLGALFCGGKTKQNKGTEQRAQNSHVREGQ